MINGKKVGIFTRTRPDGKIFKKNYDQQPVNSDDDDDDDDDDDEIME